MEKYGACRQAGAGLDFKRRDAKVQRTQSFKWFLRDLCVISVDSVFYRPLQRL